MAYLVRRDGGRWDVREAVSTPQGPRSHTLATFRPPLTPDVLARAAERARRPFDAEALRARAEALGIAVRAHADARAARTVLAQLRSGTEVDPVLVTLLRDALAAAPAAPVPAHLADVAEWIGVPPARRGATLRELLRVADRIVRARGGLPARPGRRFPRFASTRASARGRRAARAR